MEKPAQPPEQGSGQPPPESPKPETHAGEGASVEARLRASEQRFRELADSMPQLVWTADPDGTVDYYNERYREFGGISPEPGGSWQWGPALHPEDVGPTTEAWRRAVETGELYQIAHRVRRADGSYRWHLSRGVPARDESGRICKWYGTATDIDDQKKAEEEVRELQRQQQDLMRAVSHDLRNPLTSILGNTQLLQRLLRKLQVGEKETRILETILTSGRRMNSMLHDLSEAARLGMGHLDLDTLPVDLPTFVLEMKERVESPEEAERITVEAPDDLPEAMADPDHLERILTNLLSNALKYSQPGTPITVSMERGEGEVITRVADRGPGIAPEEMSNLFRRYHRAGSGHQRPGLGLGLFITKGLVEAHGGKVWAESQPGRGSSFYFSLPIDPARQR